jgi:hypothetical protein
MGAEDGLLRACGFGGVVTFFEREGLPCLHARMVGSTAEYNMGIGGSDSGLLRQQREFFDQLLSDGSFEEFISGEGSVDTYKFAGAVMKDPGICKRYSNAINHYSVVDRVAQDEEDPTPPSSPSL